VLLVTFPPSKNFEPYLHAFLSQRTNITEGHVDVFAKQENLIANLMREPEFVLISVTTECFVYLGKVQHSHVV